MSDRGAYRATFESLSDDQDFQELSFAAQAVFGSLKRKLGQYGIGVFYTAVLYELHRRETPAAVDAALAELEAPKPGRALGWIKRERNVVWIVNGLRYEPSLSLVNRNHAGSARKHAAALPKLAVVDEFLRYYGLDASAAPSSPSLGASNIPCPSHAHPMAMGGGITETERETETESETETETEKGEQPARGLTLVTGTPPDSPAAQEGGTASAAPVVAPVAGANVKPKASGLLPNSAKAVLRLAYGWTRGAGNQRQHEVRDQLRALLGDGVRYGGGIVRAVDVAHLEWACAQTLLQPHRKPDATINTVLLKIRDTYTEVLASREADQRAREVADAGELHAAADAWLAEHPEYAEEVARLAELDVPGDAVRSQIIAQARRAARTRLIDARRDAMAAEPPAVAS